MRSELKLSFNGKEIIVPVNVSEELVEKIFAEAVPKANILGMEKPVVGQVGYYEDSFNQVSSFAVTEESLELAKSLYDADNYFTDSDIANIIVRSDNILRRLRHYALTHRKSCLDMNEGGYTITYNYQDCCLECGMTANWLALGDIVFDTEEIARSAMNKYAEDLIWYFTEAKLYV